MTIEKTIYWLENGGLLLLDHLRLTLCVILKARAEEFYLFIEFEELLLLR
jgi:hypothetical protein